MRTLSAVRRPDKGIGNIDMDICPLKAILHKNYTCRVFEMDDISTLMSRENIITQLIWKNPNFVTVTKRSSF
jgi:hypothetical protein